MVGLFWGMEYCVCVRKRAIATEEFRTNNQHDIIASQKFGLEVNASILHSEAVSFENAQASTTNLFNASRTCVKQFYGENN